MAHVHFVTVSLGLVSRVPEKLAPTIFAHFGGAFLWRERPSAIFADVTPEYLLVFFFIISSSASTKYVDSSFISLCLSYRR